MEDESKDRNMGMADLGQGPVVPARATAQEATAQFSTVGTSHLTDYVKVLYKRRWLAGAIFLTIVLATVAYSFTATPIFEAKARLLIEAENQNVVSFKQVV